MVDSLLKVDNLSVVYNKKSNIFSRGKEGQIRAVDGVSFEISNNHVLGIVGESGSGKSTIAKAIMGLTKISGGNIYFEEKLLKKRTVDIQMIFQSSYSSLNPRMKIYEILSEPIIINKIMPKREIKPFLEDLMEKVRLPKSYLNRYPKQLSGGQRQRVGIARALTTNPKLIIADEPTSALDVSIQAQILNLLLDLQQDLNVSVIFISHNLAVVRYISDEVIVMKEGKIVESDHSERLFKTPKEEYTKELIRAIPSV